MKRPFEHVFSAHAATVLRVCRAVLGSDAEAEDAAAETFLSALRAYPDLDEDANVEAWLVRIAHRKAIDVTRARRRHAIPSAEIPDQPITDPSRVEGEYIWAAVRELPDKQRAVVAYRYLGGLSYAQIAEIVGGSTEAARRAGSDGVRALRTTLVPDRSAHEGARS